MFSISSKIVTTLLLLITIVFLRYKMFFLYTTDFDKVIKIKIPARNGWHKGKGYDVKLYNDGSKMSCEVRFGIF